MGAWGVESFENDDAQDWVGELEAEGLAAVGAALSEIADAAEGDYLEAPECCKALAAAEIVAALRGRPPRYLPQDAREWLAAHPEAPSARIVAVALAAVDRVLADSELRDLWDESSLAEWRADVEGLRARLG